VSLTLELTSLQYPLDGEIGRSSVQQWWGNTVYKRTLDWHNVTLLKLADGTKFGCVTGLPSLEIDDLKHAYIASVIAHN